MSNEMMVVSNPQSQGEQTQNWSSWKSWNASTNEHSAVVGMQFLKELCAAYQASLTKAKEKYEDDKKRIYNQNRSNLTSINNRENTTVNDLKKAHSDAMAAIASREKESYTAYYEDLEAYLKNNAPKGFIRKMIEKMLASQTGAMESDAQAAYQQTHVLREVGRVDFVSFSQPSSVATLFLLVVYDKSKLQYPHL